MMQVRSSSDPANGAPWFEFTLDSGTVTFTAAKGSPSAADLIGVHTLERSTDPDLAGEVHVLAVTVEGTVEFVPSSLQRPVYFAHLAWQQPDGAWGRIEFVEGEA